MESELVFAVFKGGLGKEVFCISKEEMKNLVHQWENGSKLLQFYRVNEKDLREKILTCKKSDSVAHLEFRPSKEILQ